MLDSEVEVQHAASHPDGARRAWRRRSRSRSASCPSARGTRPPRPCGRGPSPSCRDSGLVSLRSRKIRGTLPIFSSGRRGGRVAGSSLRLHRLAAAASSPPPTSSPRPRCRRCRRHRPGLRSIRLPCEYYLLCCSIRRSGRRPSAGRSPLWRVFRVLGRLDVGADVRHGEALVLPGGTLGTSGGPVRSLQASWSPQSRQMDFRGRPSRRPSSRYLPSENHRCPLCTEGIYR